MRPTATLGIVWEHGARPDSIRGSGRRGQDVSRSSAGACRWGAGTLRRRIVGIRAAPLPRPERGGSGDSSATAAASLPPNNDPPGLFVGAKPGFEPLEGRRVSR
jgi:hypothetical protein